MIEQLVPQNFRARVGTELRLSQFAVRIGTAGLLALVLGGCEWLWPLQEAQDGSPRPLADSLLDAPNVDTRGTDTRTTDTRSADTRSADKGVPGPGQCATAAGWSKRFGGSGDDAGYAIAIDADDIYITGEFSGSVDFGKGRLNSQGGSDIFLASVGCDGTPRWAKRFGGSGNDAGYHLALDGSGNLYLTGLFSGAADFDGQQLTSRGSSDGFICSFTRAGARRWCHPFGATTSSLGRALALDGQGNLFLALEFAGTMSLAGGASVTSAGGTDALLCSLTTAGAYRWCQRVGGSYDDAGWAVAVGPNGSIYFAASFQESAVYDGGSVTSAGAYDILLCRFAGDGRREWCKRFGGAGLEFPVSAAADSAGNIYLTGEFRNTVSFGGPNLPCAGESDGFLVNFDAAGNHLWSKRFSGPRSEFGDYVQLVGSALHVGGDFVGTTDFDGQRLSSAGGLDVYVCTFTSAGARQACRRLGSSGTDDFGGLAAASSGHLHLTGGFTGTSALGGEALTSAGGDDIFLSRIAP